MKKVLVLDSAIFGEKMIGNCKGLSAFIYRFLNDNLEIDISMARIDGGRELIGIVGEYNVVIMLYEGCLFDAIVSKEKCPDVRFVIHSDYVKRKKLALEKSILIIESSSESFQEMLDYIKKGEVK